MAYSSIVGKSECDSVKYWQWQFSGPACGQTISRRRDVRVDTPKALVAFVSGSLGHASLKDISRRGLCLSADVPFALGSIHSVTLVLGRMSLTRRGRTIHCHRHPTEGWVTGFEFLDAPVRPGDTSIDDLLEEVAAGDVTFR